jgi:hypothetical protein
MSTLKDREKGFERKFAHDEEMQFKAEARRNRLLGLWAAGKLGITDPDEAKTYAQQVVFADFAEKGDEDVFRKVSGDLQAKGVSVPEQEIRGEMARLLAEAKAQLMDEAG